MTLTDCQETLSNNNNAAKSASSPYCLFMMRDGYTSSTRNITKRLKHLSPTTHPGFPPTIKPSMALLAGGEPKPAREASLGPTLLSFHYRRPLRDRPYHHPACTPLNEPKPPPNTVKETIAPTFSKPPSSPTASPCSSPPPESSHQCNNTYRPQRPQTTPPPPTSLPLTPPLTLERPYLFELIDKPLPVVICPPPPPLSVHSLTSSTLDRISRSLKASYFIHCPQSIFWEWYCQNSRWLSETNSRWEYDAKNQYFIIKCMASPIHEAFTGYATFLILQEIQKYGRLRPGSNIVSLRANTDITNFDGHPSSKRVADLAIRVRLHPPTPMVYRRGVIVEVGFAQSLPSLIERAEMWVLDKQEEVHMVILLHISEQIPKSYGNVSRYRAKKKLREWRPDWFEGRDFEGEYLWRECDLTQQQILDRIKKVLVQKMLEEDEAGVLIPPLLHPLDGEIYVYERKVDKNEFSNPPPVEGHKSGNTLLVVGDNQGKRKRLDTTDSQDIWELPASSSSGEDHSSTSDNEHSTCDSAPTREHLLKCSWRTTFLESGIYTPLPTSSAHELRLPIASLYGPLPTSITTDTNQAIPQEILSIIPATLQPHAHKEIVFAMEDVAALFNTEGALPEMREQRAQERAGGVMKRELEAWRTLIRRGEMERKREGENDKRTRRIERRQYLRSSERYALEDGVLEDEELAENREIRDPRGE